MTVRLKTYIPSIVDSCQLSAMLFHSTENRLCEIHRKVVRQQFAYFVNHSICLLNDFLNQLLCRFCPESDLLGLGNPVPSLDFLDQVVISTSPHRHCEFGFLRRNFILSFSYYGMSRKYVIDWCCVVAAPCQMSNAEVFSVAISGGKHPKNELRLEKVPPVLFGIV